VDFPESLALDVVAAGLHQLERHPRAPVLVTHRKTLDLGELAEESHPQAAGGFVADKAQKMRRDQNVAVELLLDRAILLGEVHRGADRGDQHQVVRIAREADGYQPRLRLGGRWGFSAVHLRNSLRRRWVQASALENDSRAADSATAPADSSASARNRARWSDCVRPRWKARRTGQRPLVAARTDGSR